MKKSVYLLILLALQLNTNIFSQSYSVLTEAHFDEPVLSSGVLTNSKTFVLETDQLKKLTNETPETIYLSIPNIEGNNFEINLQKRDVFVGDFQVKTPSGIVNNLDYGIHYGGKLQDDPNSIVAFSFFNHCLFGMIATKNGNYNVVFLRDENNAPSNHYVLYNDRDLTIPNTFTCGTDELPKTTKAEQHYTEKSGGNTCRMLRQYLECDHRMFLDNGSSVQNTISWATGMFNVMAYLYHVELINIQISEIYVWDVADPYTDDAGAALTEFGHARQNNFNGDLAHFITTLNSGNGGLAWLDVICADYDSDYAYGPFAYSNINDAFSNLPLWSWTINVITHELGHNFGSPHTQWCGWEFGPNDQHSIDSCWTTEDYDGNACYNGPNIGRTGTIMSYCHLTGNVNLNLGFGVLPGNLIRERFNEAPCISTFNDPAMPVVTGQTQYCIGDNIFLTATSASGNVTWTGPNGFTSTSDTLSFHSAILSNSGIYVASITEGNCTSSEFVNIQVSSKPGTPTITQANGNLRCFPTSSASQYYWYDANGNLVGTGNIFLPPGPGEYYVIISRNGCESNSSALFTYVSYAGINEIISHSSINLYPNPAQQFITINYTENIIHGKLQIIDMSGRNVYTNTITNTLFSQIDVSHLNNGMYILEFANEEKTERIKFLIEH